MVQAAIQNEHSHHLTRHAERRIRSRGLCPQAVDAALRFGRIVHIRGAAIHAIGRKEITEYGRIGVDLSPWDGVQVVCSNDGTVMTVYRNRDFRGLRPRRRHRRARRS